MGIINILKKHKREKILKLISKRHLFKRYLLLIFGTFLYACAYNLFFLENNIVAGGVGGISIITRKFIEPSIMIASLSIILLIASYFTLGKKQTFNSIVGSLLYPFFVWLTKDIGSVFNISNDNLLLIAIFGGVLTGTAAGIVFKTGFTSGGTDILNQIISKYFKVSLGSAILMSDGLIVLLGGFFFGWTNVLYAIVILYIINIMVDKVVLGISKYKAVYITTTKEDEVTDFIINGLNLGATLLQSKGGYTNKKGNVVLTVIETNNYFNVKESIAQIDPNAILLVMDAYQSENIYTGKVDEN